MLQGVETVSQSWKSAEMGRHDPSSLMPARWIHAGLSGSFFPSVAKRIPHPPVGTKMDDRRRWWWWLGIRWHRRRRKRRAEQINYDFFFNGTSAKWSLIAARGNYLIRNQFSVRQASGRGATATAADGVCLRRLGWSANINKRFYMKFNVLINCVMFIHNWVWIYDRMTLV